MKLLGKVDALLISLIGAAGWTLHNDGQELGATILGGATVVVFMLGLVGGLAVYFKGGHQVPALASSYGHGSPWFCRAAVLIGIAWVGAEAAQRAGVTDDGVSAALSVLVFGAFADFVKPVKESLDELRPAAFGKKAIQTRYETSFPDGSGPKANAYQAVHSDTAEIHKDGVRVEDVKGWKMKARQQRLELIADGLK